MPGDRSRLRGVVLTEDRRTERFIRHLLVTLGFDKRNFEFKTAPSGGGAGEAWVLARYPAEVQAFRARSYQRLCVIAVRDGDAVGVSQRKTELDDALMTLGMPPRQATERIGTPVPTWAIENWLLGLLGNTQVNEARGPTAGQPAKWKEVFEHDHRCSERDALKQAADAWPTHRSSASALPSLSDGGREFDRLDL
jgi:hypothetical protein